MHTRRNFLALTATAALFAAGPASAATDLGGFVSQVARESITELSQADPTDPARAAALKAVLLKYFDMTGIARHTLGGYWKKLDAGQQQQYTDQFVNYIASVYAQRFKQYTGQKLEVKRVRDLGATGTVFTTVAGGESQGARIDWEIRNDGPAPLVTDIHVEGLSLADTHRQEFSSVMSQHGGDVTALLGILKAKSLVN